MEVELGKELLRLDQDDTGVTATFAVSGEEEVVHAKYLLGTDGAKGVYAMLSRVREATEHNKSGITRKLAGIQFLGESKQDIRMLIGDVEISGPDRTLWHKFQDARGNWYVLRR